MNDKMHPTNVDEYIKTFPIDVQEKLQQLRRTIKSVMPEAEEIISYAIPAFKFKGKYVIYFAGWKDHISLYPVPKGDADFKKELSPHITGKGTSQFLLNQPIDYDLVKRFAEHRLHEALNSK